MSSYWGMQFLYNSYCILHGLQVHCIYTYMKNKVRLWHVDTICLDNFKSSEQHLVSHNQTTFFHFYLWGQSKGSGYLSINFVLYRIHRFFGVLIDHKPKGGIDYHWQTEKEGQWVSAFMLSTPLFGLQSSIVSTPKNLWILQHKNVF